MMKKLLFFLLLSLVVHPFVHADESEVVVKVAMESAVRSRDAQEQLDSKAKAAAVRKYLKTHDSNLPETVVEKCCAEASKFIEDIELEGTYKWSPVSQNLWQVSGEYTVELKSDEINKFLKVQGAGVQGNLEIVILEEPPSIGSMKQQSDVLNAIRDFYTNFQRRIRDYILKNTDKFGLDIKLLEDNDLYKEYKSKDSTLVGVFYDADQGGFAINRELLDKVKANNEDTIALYYRIETLDYDPSAKDIRVTVALSFKNLAGGITKSIGTAPFQVHTNANTPGMLMDDIGICAEKAIASLMNANGASAKINTLITEIRNIQNQPAGPLAISFNAEVVDAKIRKKVMYGIKKQLVAAGYAENTKVKTSNTTLTAELLPKYTDAEDFYMEHFADILEKVGVELDDDKVHYQKGKLIIRP